ncbi:hydroxymethylglutaryl-CoA synthase [Synchytrium endobioticum]|uniref:Hydroxymethylglutaryl-CoA synthase n=1 Tax=Synchytrium endobioticum TaxID=286115 RepID=A0A507DI76_9FUNG|nr:hydroxymethylglutaryl-CoA synthase [Synchytrium endobioticum]TPX50598.1 hydroxymethylglutaryl-CoA synthase [Synchytrium endobioticum]
MSSRPENVGIHAVEIYFPKKCVDQSELEKHDGVSEGKYTVGLGQTRMGFCDDREDINSLSLTAVQNLMEKYKISYSDIGRLEVGTETITDKSKSTKTVLMTLFAASGNTNIEGVTTTNACYGGTNALFNALNWIESSYWDGRYALVVAGDIAVYKEGNARPTGGAGCVAILLGANAPIVFERGLRASYMEHAWDFFKPDMNSEYPEVDGKLSVECYLRAVDKCYNQYMDKLAKTGETANIDAASYFLFHSPYTKLVQKSFGRYAFNDFLRHQDDPKYDAFTSLKAIKPEDSYFNRDVEKTFVDATKDLYKKKVMPTLLCAKEIGNMYCGSLYGGLVSLISETPNVDLLGKRVIMFSYGSGLASSMFSFKVVGDTSSMASNLRVKARLASRTICPPATYDEVMNLREHTHNLRSYDPKSTVDEINQFPGTFFLERVDDKFRRAYARTPLSTGGDVVTHVINGVNY